MKRKNKLKFMCCVVIASICLIFVLGSVTSRGSEGNDEKYKVVSVKEGDTLWSIVKANCKNSDIRQVIYYVEKENNMESVNLTPGQTIRIPVKYTY